MSRDKALTVSIVFVVLLGTCVAAATAADILRFVTGTHGTVTISACTRDNGFHKTPTYDCAGTFTSADGRTTLAGVTFTDSYAADPGDTRPATLNGSTAGDVNPVNYASVATGTIVSTLCLVAAVLLVVTRVRRSGRGRP